MPKVMLVEDDNNLREIYDARLVAEGYTIVSAHDGEEALALAVKERPDLIISDVMMPKISGFDMLDILRSTPETKNTKVIMMTALGQAEDRERADKLGADRYLVKSQVTLEDVIKVAHEVLNDTPAPVVAPAAPAAAAPVADMPVVAAPPVADPAPAPVAAEPPKPVDEPATVAEPPAPAPVADPAPAPAPVAAPVVATPPAEPPKAEETPVAAEPIDDTLTQTKADETNGVEQQIQDFITNNPTIPGAADATPAATAVPPVPPLSAATPAGDDNEPPMVIATPEGEPVVENPATAPAVPPAQEQLSNPSDAAHAASDVPEPPSHRKLVLTPTENALAPSVDINALLEKENAKSGEDEAVETPPATAVITPSGAQETPAPGGTVNPSDISL